MLSEEIFQKSKLYMPGGVNSPVRAYRGMDMLPPIMKSGKGIILKDEDGREYIDFVLSWGPMLLGHCNDKVVKAIVDTAANAISFGSSTKLELEMAELLCTEMDGLDMVRMVNSGTEATMSAVKLARGYTHRDKIIKFAGCYHGHYDGFLVEAGSGVLTERIPGSPGIPEDNIRNTLIGVYNDLEQVKKLFEDNKDEIAAIIIEPVAGNMGVVKADISFLEGIRKLCDDNGALLIFDEVMCGFRIAYKGAQEVFKVKPDLITYAKIIGGGLPCGAYGGRKDIMMNLSPVGNVYQAGTMSGNPIVMAAGLATLKQIRDNHKEYYAHIEMMGTYLEEGIENIAKNYNIPVTVNRVGGMFTLFFTKGPVNNYEDVKKCDIEMFNRYFKHMITHGINLAPSQYEAVFLSVEHKKEHIDKFLKEFENFAKEENM